MAIQNGNDVGLAQGGVMQAALPAGAVFEPFAPPADASPSLQQADAYPELLSTSPAGVVSRRLALAVVIVSSAFFFIAAPLAKEPMTPLWAFIPIYQSALVINALITAVLLFGQFAILRSKGLLVLAAGYLFTACMATAHGLTFPGLFAPTGLLGAGTQSTAWLYMFWHGVFPLCVMGYCVMQGRTGAASLFPGRATTPILVCIGVVLIAVVALTALATAGHDYLPPIMQHHQYTPAMLTVVSAVWALSAIALALLWWWRRPPSVLDVWLLVVMCAWIFDVALSAVLNSGRFDLGFYMGRIYGLLAASFVLVVLLLENGALYTKLAAVLQSERAKAAELAAANKELDAFAYSVSHDLGAPLRAINGFTAILQNEHAASLGARGTETLNRIIRNANRMQQMLEDMLRFSRCSRQALTKELVDVTMLVGEVLAAIREQQSERSVEVTIGELPECLADRALLRQVFVNLLSNAFKFTRTRPQPRVEIGFAAFALGPAYFVRDNGAGFDIRYAQRLFGVFSRLHRVDQFEGSGVGLSLVQRIVQRHGGRVGAEAKPDEGACFYFTLPSANGLRAQ